MSFALSFAHSCSLAATAFSRGHFLASHRPTDMDDATGGERAASFAPVKLPPSSSGPRPHRCDICQRSFREIATLRKHEQLHRADRPYVCQTCGKSFLWSSNLKVHERVHTGERPYKCKICHRCFTQSNDLRRHERNVHMRGKLYGYKHAPGGVGAVGGRGGVGAGGGGSHVNLAAYQAFAMQQRALLQQALTYESYLHTSGVTQPQMFPQPQAPVLQAKADRLTAMGLAGGVPGPMGLARMEAEGRGHDLQRSPVKLEQVTPPATPGGGVGVDGEGEKRGAGHSPLSPRFLPTSSATCPVVPPLALGHAPLHSPPSLIPMPHPGYTKDPSSSSSPLHPHHPHHAHPNAGVVAPRHASPHPHHPHHAHPQLSPSGGGRGSLPAFSSFRHPPQGEGGAYDTQGLVSPSHHHHHHHHHHNPQPHPQTLGAGLENGGRGEGSEGGGACDSVMDLSISSRTPDLHRPSSLSSGSSDKTDRPATATSTPGGDDRAGGGAENGGGAGERDMPPPKTPGSESECEGKRDVTTTSSTPGADSGVHHCQHCRIVFYDYTMFHLHESLHMPYEAHPFRCPSCGRHCQDRIEFMFHTVWHVRYPHTIPNYQPFKDNFVS